MGRNDHLIRPIVYPRGGAGSDPAYRTPAEIAAMNDAVTHAAEVHPEELPQPQEWEGTERTEVD